MESRNIKWRRQWDDESLRQICGFANGDGGVMKIGVEDDGSVVGVKEPESDMRSIANDIADRLSIRPAVEVDEATNVITITVRRSPVPVNLDGRFYIRIGGTTHAVTGREFGQLTSRRLSVAWSDMPEDGLDISCLDGCAIDLFRRKARSKGRIDERSLDVSDRDLLIGLGLMTPEGALTRAAVLLFHPHPEEAILGSAVKVGMFEGTNSPEILYQDYIGGPLISMPDRLYDLISTKYSMRRVSYEGLQMVETPPFPESSLRETILNAVMHNEYGSRIPIQIRVWEDRIRIADSGGIPYDWSPEDLLKDHKSVPTNPGLANVFFLAGFVEGWGRGIQRIMDGYSEYPDRPPTFEVSHLSFTVVLKNVNYGLEENIPDKTPVARNDTESLLMFLDHPEGRSSREVATFLGLASKNIVPRKINPLIERGLVERTIPDAASSRYQRYRTTDAGREYVLRRTRGGPGPGRPPEAGPPSAWVIR